MVPLDKIQQNQYTRGNEFVLDGKYYQGYYCIVLENQYYTGKTYTQNSKKLTKVELPPLPSKITSLPPQYGLVRYFLKQINRQPIVIKEVDEKTYNEFLNNPFYEKVSLKTSDIYLDSVMVEEADKKMVGLKTFLLSRIFS